MLNYAGDIAKFLIKQVNKVERSGQDADFIRNFTNSKYNIAIKALRGEDEIISFEDIKNIVNTLAKFFNEMLKKSFEDTPGPPPPDFTLKGNTREEIRHDIANIVFSTVLWLVPKFIEGKSDLMESPLVPKCYIDLLEELPSLIPSIFRAF